MENIQIINKDVLTINDNEFNEVDFVVMNPPFGTKNNENIFQSFFEKAVQLT